MLNYDEFIKEKFDYNKQKKEEYKSIFSLVKGDTIYIHKIRDNKISLEKNIVSSIKKSKNPALKNTMILTCSDGKEYRIFSENRLNYPIIVASNWLQFNPHTIISTNKELLLNFDYEYNTKNILSDGSTSFDLLLIVDKFLKNNFIIEEKFDYTKQVKPIVKNINELVNGDYIFVYVKDENVKKYKIDKITPNHNVISLGRNGYLQKFTFGDNSFCDFKEFDAPICFSNFVDKNNVSHHYTVTVVSTNEEIIHDYINKPKNEKLIDFLQYEIEKFEK